MSPQYQNFAFYDVKHIDSSLPWVCTVNEPQKTFQCGKNIGDTLTHQILTPSVICHCFLSSHKGEFYLQKEKQVKREAIYLATNGIWIYYSHFSCQWCEKTLCFIFPKSFFSTVFIIHFWLELAIKEKANTVFSFSGSNL